MVKVKETPGNSDPLQRSMDKVVRMLLPTNEEADDYIRSHSNFSFYIYDLPPRFTWQQVVSKLQRIRAEEDVCDWGTSICSYKNSTPDTKFSKKRLNRNVDVALAKLLTEYNGTMRTYDPYSADVLIVPYPTAAVSVLLPQNYAKTEADLFQSLAFWNESTSAHKHLFLASMMLYPNTPVGRAPSVASIGKTDFVCKDARQNCGRFAVPYLNTNEEYQPDVLVQMKSIDERKTAVTAMFNANVAANSLPRLEFMEAVEKFRNETDGSLAGLPLQVKGYLARFRRIGSEGKILESYRDSIFCPILRGDTPNQKRFFDVILSGCIPVALEYPSSEAGCPSHFGPGLTSIRTVYPFSTGTFVGIPSMGIEYRDFIVAVNGTCGPPCILPALEDLLINQKERLRQMHRKLAAVAQLLTYGLDDNARRYPDALAAMLVEVRHYAHNHQLTRSK